MLAASITGGIEVYGEEYSFGGLPPNEEKNDRTGISRFEPRKCADHTFLSASCLGLCTKSQGEVLMILRDLCGVWTARSYDLLARNCVSFSREFSALVCPSAVRTFPDWVDSFARAGARVRAARSGKKRASADVSEVEVPLDAVVLHSGRVEKQSKHLGRWKPVEMTVRLRTIDWTPCQETSIWMASSRGLAGSLSLDPRRFVGSQPTEKDGACFEIHSTGQTLVFRCSSMADARKWASIVSAVVLTAEAVPNTTESFLVRRVALAGDEDSADTEDFSPSPSSADVRCLQGHSCTLETRGRRGGKIACAKCSRLLDNKEALWLCEECSFHLCRLCSASHVVY